MAKIITFAIAIIIGGIALGAIGASMVSRSPVAAEVADSRDRTARSDETAPSYRDDPPIADAAPLPPPREPDAQMQADPEADAGPGYVPDDGAGADDRSIEGRDDDAAAPIDDSAARAAEAAREAADDARSAETAPRSHDGT